MNPVISNAARRFAAERVVSGSVVAIESFEAGSQVYPVVDGDSLVLGPECFATGSFGGEPVDGTKIAWKGVWFGTLPDTTADDLDYYPDYEEDDE